MPKVETIGGPDINLVRTGPTGSAPIVFLHALGLDLTWWDHQIEEFGRDYDVVAFDLPGHGLSGRLDRRPTFDGMARAVMDVLAQVNAGPAHLVGISFGGMVAQTMAVARPDLVRSLTLVATSCTFPEAIRQVLRERGQVARSGGMETIAPLHLERWFPPAFRTQRPDVLDRAVKLLLQQDPELHASLWDIVAKLDVEQRLSALTCPTMVVAGGEDMSASAAAGQLIVNQISGATLHVMADCGHFPPMEAPGTFNALLRRYLLAA